MAKKGNVLFELVKRKDFDRVSEIDCGAFTELAKEVRLAIKPDGNIIRKIVTEYPSLFDNAKRERVSNGWKRYAKIKDGKTSEDFKNYYVGKGYELV